jgi:hypothetical protein
MRCVGVDRIFDFGGRNQRCLSQLKKVGRISWRPLSLQEKPDGMGLSFRPIDDVEKHSALKHVALEICGVFSPFRRFADAESGLHVLSLECARAPRMPSYIMVRLSLVNA